MGPTTRQTPCIAKLLCGLLCVLATGCDRDLKVPPAPDLKKLAEVYKEPDGKLDGALLKMVLRDAAERIARAEGIGELAVVRETVQRLRETEHRLWAEDGNITSDAGAPTVLASVMRVCRGDADYAGEPDSDANGYIELRVTASREGLRPTVWGEAVNCRDHAKGKAFSLDGEIALNFTVEKESLVAVARIVGRIESAGQVFNGRFDFRASDQGSLEVRVPVVEGSVIVGAAESGKLQVVRDVGDVWRCEIQQLNCTAADGRELSFK